MGEMTAFIQSLVYEFNASLYEPSWRYDNEQDKCILNGFEQMSKR